MHRQLIKCNKCGHTEWFQVRRGDEIEFDGDECVHMNDGDCDYEILDESYD